MSKQIIKYDSLLQQNKNCYIEKRTIKAGEYFGPHWHDYFELEIVLDGAGEHIYNNTNYTLSRGSIYLMSYYDFHELSAQEDMQILKLQFNENVLPSELNDFLFLSHNCFCCTLEEKEIQHLIKLFVVLKSEETQDRIFRDLLIKNLIAEIIITVIRNSSEGKKSVMPSLLQKAVAYVRNNFRERLTLEQLAKHCYVTPNYLGVQFTKKMGISFSDYINIVRLRYACNLLDSTDLTVKEIAFASGYNSVEHFGYTFKKILNESPLNYKKRSPQASIS